MRCEGESGVSILPVEPFEFNVVAVVFHVVKKLHLCSGVPHHFLGYATHIDAGTADGSSNNDCSFDSIFSSTPRVGNATRAAPNNNKIIMFACRSHCGESTRDQPQRRVK